MSVGTARLFLPRALTSRDVSFVPNKWSRYKFFEDYPAQVWHADVSTLSLDKFFWNVILNYRLVTFHRHFGELLEGDRYEAV